MKEFGYRTFNFRALRLIFRKNLLSCFSYTVKRTASILLLIILAFNWLGYRFISNIMERKANIAFEDRIERSDYDESNLIELRIPLNAPYISGHSEAFERYDGEIEIEGVHYKYVKRKIVNGDLVLLCIPNETKNRFENLEVDFFKLVNDLDQPGQENGKKSSSAFKSLVTEYSKENNSWSIAVLPLLPIRHTFANISYSASVYKSILKPPPKA